MLVWSCLITNSGKITREKYEKKTFLFYGLFERHPSRSNGTRRQMQISMQITRKRIKKINASYTLEGMVLSNVETLKYLGITITNDLKWNTHVSNICTKANRTLGFLRRNLAACSQDVKESAYKGLVGSVLEYGSSVGDPQSILLQDEQLEKVQKRAARFLTRKLHI